MNKSFGLDIGATNIKVVSLTKAKNGYILNSALAVPTPIKGMQSESPLDQEEIARVIGKVVNESKVNSRYAHIALLESQLYTKVLEMPSLSDKELKSAIYWEAERNIPVPLSSVAIDWQVLYRAPKQQIDSKILVLLVGAPLVLVEKYKKILSMAGVSIASIEIELLSTIRSLVIGPNFPNSIIINIGSISTSLAIIKRGIVVFIYSISTGGAAINRAIAADFGFTLSQAEEYKKAYGVSRESLGGKIGQSTSPILMAIITEIKKAMSYYSEKYKNEDPIQQIILSGGTAKLPNIDIFFAQNCGVETVIANPWKALINQSLPKEMLDTAPLYTTAVGLAMKD